MYFVYILKCADNSYYVGTTTNLKKRLKDHNDKKGADFTAKRSPCVIVYFEKFSKKSKVIARESQIKKLSESKKKI